MKLWLLTRPEEDVGWDERAGCIIRAETEAQARQIAHDTGGGDEESAVWLDPKTTACVEVTPAGKPGIILTDFNAG